MLPWNQALRRAAVSGSVASVLSMIALGICGYLETGRAAAPINAISHWLWEGEATRRNRPNLRHTAIGYAIHHASSVFWAIFYEKWFGPKHPESETVIRAVRNGAAISTLACFVDYELTPDRLKPGYETRISARSLFFVYAAFALGLGLGSVLRRSAAPRT